MHGRPIIMSTKDTMSMTFGILFIFVTVIVEASPAVTVPSTTPGATRKPIISTEDMLDQLDATSKTQASSDRQPPPQKTYVTRVTTWYIL